MDSSIPACAATTRFLTPTSPFWNGCTRRVAINEKIAAFGAWDVFPYIFNASQTDFPVNAGYDQFTPLPDDTVVCPKQQVLLNAAAFVRTCAAGFRRADHSSLPPPISRRGPCRCVRQGASFAFASISLSAVRVTVLHRWMKPLLAPPRASWLLARPPASLPPEPSTPAVSAQPS